MSLSDAELDKKLVDLLKVMISRLPADKKLSAPVVQQLLKAKYPTVYPEAYVTSHESFIADSIAYLTKERDAAAPSTAAAETKARAEAASESEEDSEESGSSEEDEEDDEEGDDEGDEENDEDSDEEDFDSSDEEDDDGDEDDGDGDGSDAPEKKKARQEEEAVIAAKTTTASSADVADRCKAMVACLKKLSYRVRAPNAEESLEDYLNGYLVGEFTKHKMDPNKYDKNDIKYYKIQREVELLQQDGASLQLDKRNRVGRGYAGAEATAAAAAPSNYKTSAFLDDEE